MLTVPALREAVYVALTSPPLQYTVDQGGSYGSATLPPANVVPRSVWLTGSNPPSPLIAFAVQAVDPRSRYTENMLRLHVWVVADDELTATYVYAAVKARLNLADSSVRDAFAPADLSRVASSSNLGIAVRECRELEALPCDFDKDTGRWYVSARYGIVAR